MVAWMQIIMAIKGMMGGGKGGGGDDFEGMGLGGFEFEEEGYQQRNMENLLETFGSKKTTDAIENLSKIKPENWERLAESTQAIIDMAGQLDPGIITQLGDTIKEYFGARMDAMIAEFLAPYLPYLMDMLNLSILPAIDGIFSVVGGITNSIGVFFDEIFSGFTTGKWFPRITQALDQIIWQNQQAQLERARQRKQQWYNEVFFPEMDQLYADHPEAFIGDADIIAEQTDLRPNRPGQSPGESQGTTTDPYRWNRLEDI